jgi:hypothetical protein
MNEPEKISSAADVEWQRYEYVNENPKGTATKRRLTLVKKVTKVGEMFDYRAFWVFIYIFISLPFYVCSRRDFFRFIHRKLQFPSTTLCSFPIEATFFI